MKKHLRFRQVSWARIHDTCSNNAAYVSNGFVFILLYLKTLIAGQNKNKSSISQRNTTKKPHEYSTEFGEARFLGRFCDQMSK